VNQVVVLCYHAVSPTWSAPLSVTPDALDQQLTTLTRRGWHGVTFRQAVLGPHAPRTLAVTFDDAFASVLTLAHPILAALGLPATVFAPTAFMSGRRLSWPGIDHWAATAAAPELTGMTWSQLGLLADQGWEIGSHTHTHPRLTQLDDGALRDELERSRAECAEHVPGAGETIAYPYGDVDERVAAAAGAAGYAAGATLSRSLAQVGAYRWPRVGIYRVDRGWRFELKTNHAVRLLRASRAWRA
jgi:peptidoglycan/xylan/chitin deacetylase (PgdA/CDA1 family)